MKYIVFKLSMPSVGTWNNKWSGAGNFYAYKIKLKDNVFSKIDLQSSYNYNFGDGWTANISVQIFDKSKGANFEMKGSKGFCGYEWMIDSILKYNEIRGDINEELS